MKRVRFVLYAIIIGFTVSIWEYIGHPFYWWKFHYLRKENLPFVISCIFPFVVFSLTINRERTKHGLSGFLPFALFFITLFPAIYMRTTYNDLEFSFFVVCIVGLIVGFRFVHGTIVDLGNSTRNAAKTARFNDEIKEAYGAREMGTYMDLNVSTHAHGFYIGYPYWHWFGDGHILTVGGSGSGKNAAIILPNFLSDRFTATGTSVFCLDPKGENYYVSKDWLESQGYTVYRINPTDIFGMGTDNFNLFDMIQWDSPNVSSFCQAIASALAPIKGKSETSDHFNDKAQGILFIYMLYMLDTLGSESSFSALYDIVMVDGRRRMDLLKIMQQSRAYNGIVANEAASIHAAFELGGGEEMSGAYSSAAKSLKSFRDLQLRRVVSRSSFTLDQLISEKTAVFINIPFGQLKDAAGWVRSMVATLSNMMEKRTDRSRRLLIMLDEFTRLGHMAEVEDGFVALRSFGVTYHIVVQDFQQLQHNYPGTYKSFFGSSSVKHVLNVEDAQMAKMLSDMTGKSINVVNMGDNHAPHIVHKQVVTPDEFQNNHHHHYLFLRGMPNVIKLPKVGYYKNQHFNGRWRQNPLHQHA